MRLRKMETEEKSLAKPQSRKGKTENRYNRVGAQRSQKTDNSQKATKITKVEFKPLFVTFVIFCELSVSSVFLCGFGPLREIFSSLDLRFCQNRSTIRPCK